MIQLHERMQSSYQRNFSKNQSATGSWNKHRSGCKEGTLILERMEPEERVESFVPTLLKETLAELIQYVAKYIRRANK